MRAHRKRSIVGIAVLVSVVFAGAACGNDDDDGENAQAETGSTGEAPSEPTITQAATSSTTEPTSGPATTDAQTSAHDTCPHVTNVVLVQNPEDAVLTLPPNVDALDPNDVPEFLGWEFPPDIEPGEALATMFAENAITAYEVTDPAIDSLQVASEIESDNSTVAGLVATPLLLLTLTGHWGMSPADDPEPATEPGDMPSASIDETVAVVDTGYTDAGDEFQWLNERVDPVDTSVVDFDAEPTQSPLPIRVAGHGSFVSSIIVQEAPNVAVRVARLDAIDLSVVPINLAPPVFTTDELQLYIAVQRLLNLDVSYAALNLSLGAYACEDLGLPAVDNSGLAIRAAIDLWINHAWDGPVPPIVAAAGNHVEGETSPLPPFLPAAYDTGANDSIYPVMSIDEAGHTSAFSNRAAIGALGERLIGVGPDVHGWTYWSGSSFATALLTARTLLEGSISPGTLVTTPDNVQTEPPTTNAPTTAPSNTTGSTATTTTRPPGVATTTTLV